MKIGIDVGGVIMDRANDDTDTSFFSDNYLQTTAVAGAVASIVELVEQYGAPNIYIVSKAGDKTQKRTWEWMDHKRFFDTTGMLRENVHFCAERKDKADICGDLGITDFIDDKIEVLSYMDSRVVGLIAFDPTPFELKRFREYRDLMGRVKVLKNWTDVLSCLNWESIKRRLAENQ